MVCVQGAKKVCIIGGGVGGLTFGFSLRKLCPAVQVTMFEARPNVLQTELGGGVQISAGASILKKLGILSNFQRLSLPLHRILARNEFGEELLSINLNLCRQDPIAFTIMRNALVEMLYNQTTKINESNGQFAPLSLELGKVCVGLMESSDQISLAFEDGSTADGFDLVIGADGLSSIARSFVDSESQHSMLSSPFDAVTGRTGMRITYCVTPHSRTEEAGTDAKHFLRADNHGALHQWFGDGTYALTGSYGSGEGMQHMLAVVYRSDETAPLGVNPGWKASTSTANEVQHILEQAGLGDNPEILSLLGASQLEGGRTIDLSVRDSIVPLKSWSSASGRVILLGDSAHPM